MDILREKIKQTGMILREVGIDAWLVLVRETPVLADPVLPLVVGREVTWESFFLYTSGGKAVALVGEGDQADFVRSGIFAEVRHYVQSPADDFMEMLQQIDPKSLAINYSLDDPSSDGLTHGMYLLLTDYLIGTPYANRLVSAEGICSKLRSRKTVTEMERLTSAAVLAESAWKKAVDELEPGMSEREIAEVIDGHVRRLGAEPSFPTIVNAGDKTEPGHSRPTDAKIEAGDLLHVDFGARQYDYCSDLQRLVYFQRDHETSPPAKLTDAFSLVARIITETSKRTVPRVLGHEIDAVAREMLRDGGYDEYQHALGHQLGRNVHDGGALIGPKWERYGKAPSIPIETDNVFTLELEINLPGIGCVGLEEDVHVTEGGALFLCPRQQELIVK